MLRRLHSLSGVVPVGLFLVFHIWINAHAAGGQRAFDRAVEDLQSIPYLWLIELVFVLVPLLYHAGYGLSLSFRGRPTVARYPTTRNWLHTLQRASGVLTLLFLGYHLWQFRLQTLLGRMAPPDFFQVLTGTLSTTVWSGIPLVALVYLLGVAAAVFHFSNGLVAFCSTWGVTTTRKGAKVASAVAGALGIVLFVLGANSVIYLATGSRLLPYTDGVFQ